MEIAVNSATGAIFQHGTNIGCPEGHEVVSLSPFLEGKFLAATEQPHRQVVWNGKQTFTALPPDPEPPDAKAEKLLTIQELAKVDPNLAALMDYLGIPLN